MRFFALASVHCCQGASKCRSTTLLRWNEPCHQGTLRHSSSNRFKGKALSCLGTSTFGLLLSCATDMARWLSLMKFRQGLAEPDVFLRANIGVSNQTWFSCLSLYQAVRCPSARR